SIIGSYFFYANGDAVQSELASGRGNIDGKHETLTVAARTLPLKAVSRQRASELEEELGGSHLKRGSRRDLSTHHVNVGILWIGLKEVHLPAIRSPADHAGSVRGHPYDGSR